MTEDSTETAWFKIIYVFSHSLLYVMGEIIGPLKRCWQTDTVHRADQARSVLQHLKKRYTRIQTWRILHSNIKFLTSDLSNRYTWTSKKNRNAEVQTDEALFLCMYVCISCSQKKQMPELWGSKTLVSLWEASPRSKKNTINRNKSLHQSHFWVRGKKKNADPFSCSYSKPEVS